MPYTTKELVKKHILDHHIGSTTIADEAVKLDGADWAALQRRMVLASSETVKGKELSQPTLKTLEFASGDQLNLNDENLIPDSVVIASDSSLGRIYVENVDYSVDYYAGIIRRIGGGSIPPGSAAVIWYLRYRKYQRGVDYDIDYQNGKLRRRSSGAIESGQQVLVDYMVEYGSLDDAAIENAIGEANEQISAFVDEKYRESQDRGLVIAETYLAVSIIARIRGMESISPSKAKSVNEASSWAAISEMYRKEAYNILSRYAAAQTSLKPPAKA